MNKTIDVVALGEAMVEFNQTHPGQPQYLQGFGGDTSNAVIAAARAGVKTAYLTRVGADTFGNALIDLWAGENVSTALVERDAAHPTGIYFVTHGQNGHEFSYLRAGSAASRMTPQWLQAGVADTIAAARVLHLSGISLAISPNACDTAFAAMRVAREAGTLVSFDSNLRLKLWPLDRARACMALAVSLCDVFLPSLEDVTALVGISDPDEVADWGHSLGAPTVVLKLGPEGALISQGIGAANKRERIPGHKVQLVDATGAGDCFCGNLLAQLAKGTPVVQAARYANAAAAIAVQGFGAVAPLPRQAEVEAML
ncbi:2-dehydro-3-deoxygluconokinase [Rhodoferax koreense]|uniref:2-dehydro-3-deoxygluconokinase n=1 Tax=Rhodoferax koreensis TaxID=1842727 RepID=A0A1P8JWJ0_9BURK|nr:sugar kinase [Rhodoferax koreense]APW38031.1 2-dehydro-3-deoxygluconokinase [Rhodoferax koreense]